MRIRVGDPDSHKAKVYLNGIELSRCIMADEEKGEALCYVQPSTKDLEGDYKSEMLKGVVKVVIE